MLTPNKLHLTTLNWGLIEYNEALQTQLSLLDQVAENPEEGFLVFCTHPPVVTLGRKTEVGDVFDWSGQTIEIARGGRATYHGPSQLVVYPIFPVRDIHLYLRSFEEGIVKTLSDFNVSAVGKSLQKKDPHNSGTEETGVWVGHQKIASLGIGIKKWITYHGAAINLDNDPQAFWGMNPCGFKKEVMTNLEIQTNQSVNRSQFQQLLEKHLRSIWEQVGLISKP